METLYCIGEAQKVQTKCFRGSCSYSVLTVLVNLRPNKTWTLTQVKLKAEFDVQAVASRVE